VKNNRVFENKYSFTDTVLEYFYLFLMIQVYTRKLRVLFQNIQIQSTFLKYSFQLCKGIMINMKSNMVFNYF
jgi:hypothetical protein